MVVEKRTAPTMKKRGLHQTLPEKWDDVIVIGTGFSGLAAAIEAKDAGAGVVILEKMRTVGGNSVLAGGCLSCADPERQLPQGIEDSPEKHFQQTWAAGDYRCDPERIKAVIDEGLDALHWLEKMGVEWKSEVHQGYGGLWPRSHTPVKGGFGVVQVLKSQVEKRGIPILLRHEVIRIIREKLLEGRVLGVEVQTKAGRLIFKAKKGVINASGGFNADVNLRMRCDHRLGKELRVTGSKEATGDLIILSQDIGAAVVGMDHVQCNPRAYDVRNGKSYSSKILSQSDIPYIIYVNCRGKRIVNSDARRDAIRDAILNQPEKVSFIICDDKLRQLKGVSLEETWRKVKDRRMFGGNSIKDLAENMTVPPDALTKTIDEFNSYVDERHDPDFEQAPSMLINKIETPPFWATMLSMAVHYTCGGLRVGGTRWTQVLDRCGRIVPGYYAAGEVTGGFHGTNRLGGNATLECIVAGRWAGKAAAKEG